MYQDLVFLPFSNETNLQLQVDGLPQNIRGRRVEFRPNLQRPLEFLSPHIPHLLCRKPRQFTDQRPAHSTCPRGPQALSAPPAARARLPTGHAPPASTASSLVPSAPRGHHLAAAPAERRARRPPRHVQERFAPAPPRAAASGVNRRGRPPRGKADSTSRGSHPRPRRRAALRTPPPGTARGGPGTWPRLLLERPSPGAHCLRLLRREGGEGG